MEEVRLKRFLKRLLGYGFLAASLFMLVISLIGFRYSESKEKMTTTWDVEYIFIDGEDVTDNFYTFSLNLRRDSTAFFPDKKYQKPSSPLVYSTWHYERVGFIDAQITIEDLDQGIFDGVYYIEVLTQNEPQRLLLSSDRIDLYIRKALSFTINRRTLPMFSPVDTILKYRDTSRQVIDTLNVEE